MSSFMKPNLFNNYIKFSLLKEEQDKVIRLKRERQKYIKRQEKRRRQEERRRREERQERRRQEERRRREETSFQLSFNYLHIMNHISISNIAPILDDYTSNQPTILSIKDFNKLNKCKYNNKYNKTCTICFDEFELNQTVIQLKCNHNYHINCIKEWLCNNSNKCPLCKIPVIS